MNKKYFLAVLFCLGLAGVSSVPAQLVWTGNVDNTWDTTTTNWLNGGMATPYVDGSNVVFNDSSLQTTVNITGSVSPASIIVTNNANTYMFTNGAISGNGWLRKEGAGALVLAASNSFSGGITFNTVQSSNIVPLLVSRAVGALGTGPVIINRTSSNYPTLQFETPFKTNINDITVTGTVGKAVINTFGVLTLQGNLTMYGGNSNSLNIMFSNSAQSLLVFNQAAAGNKVNLGTNGMINHYGGLLDPVSPLNFPTNYYLSGNGILLLSPGFNWSNLVAGRMWVNSSAPSGGQWSGNNFAARGANQVIDGTGAFNPGNSNNWASLKTGITLGSVVTNADGTFYANAGVKITRDFYATGLLPVNVVNQGPGNTNRSSVGIIHELAGTISGTGVVSFVGTGVSANDGQVAELVLSGASQWTGADCWDYQSSQRLITGPGGLVIGSSTGGGNPVGFIRFKGNASLPSGNNGSNSYILVCGRFSNYAGYLFTGSTSNEVYSLTSGVRFVIGGNGLSATLGSAIGTATLSDGMVSIFSSNSNDNRTVYLLVRDTNSVFALGSSPGAVRFSSCYSGSNSANQGWLSSTNAATPMFDRFATNTLVKRGPGTLVLSNVQYTLFNGSGDITTNFAWEIGSDTAGYFDGVVRETGTAVSNSLRMMPSVTMKGGVMGLTSNYSPTLGTSSINGQVFNMAWPSGGGFAAYGGKCVVTLTPRGGNVLNWSQNSPANADFFMAKNEPLLLSAPDADSPIEISSASSNVISLGTGATNVVICVYDNPATNTDQAIIDIPIVSAGGSNLIKSGAGTLTLTATNNNWYGTTSVTNGTLIVNGAILRTNSSIIVYSGATLSGTGVIGRAVNVMAGGTLTAGTLNSPSGTLTINSNVDLSGGGTLLIDVSGRIVVSGAVTNGGPLQVTANNAITPGGYVTNLTAAGGFVGSFTSTNVPTNYVIIPSADNKNLILHRNSGGFVFRIQ